MLDPARKSMGQPRWRPEMGFGVVYPSHVLDSQWDGMVEMVPVLPMLKSLSQTY